MKKNIGVLLLCFTTLNSMACDICNMSVSLTPDDTKNSMSIFYRHRHATRTFSNIVYMESESAHGSRHGGVVLIPGLEEQTQTETYSVLEARGTYNISDRFNVSAILPFVHNERLINGENQFTIQGIGDPILLAKYSLIRTRYTEEDKMNHRLTIGTGIKLPLGKYDFENNGVVVEHDIQAGTGTVDFIFSLSYMLKYKNIGVLFNTNYKANTYNNKADYIFGNTNNTTLNLFYMKKLGESITILPYLGGYTEIGSRDIENKVYEDNTGGSLLFGTVGFQFYYKKLKLETFYQHTLVNNLNGTLQLNTKNRIQIGLTYLFK